MMGFYGVFGGMGGLVLGYGLFGGVMMLLFWVAIIALAVLVARALFAVPRESEHDVAVDVLKHRFAAGEISQAEYEQARKALG